MHNGQLQLKLLTMEAEERLDGVGVGYCRARILMIDRKDIFNIVRSSRFLRHTGLNHLIHVQVHFPWVCAGFESCHGISQLLDPGELTPTYRFVTSPVYNISYTTRLHLAHLSISPLFPTQSRLSYCVWAPSHILNLLAYDTLTLEPFSQTSPIEFILLIIEATLLPTCYLPGAHLAREYSQ